VVVIYLITGADTQLYTEAAMADEVKRTVTLRKSEIRSRQGVGQSALIQPRRQRTAKELEPIAGQVAENAAVMERFRASIGSNKKALGLEVMDEVTEYAQKVDPTISVSEGTRITAILLRKLGHFK
jgi:hypothetical protein